MNIYGKLDENQKASIKELNRNKNPLSNNAQ